MRPAALWRVYKKQYESSTMVSAKREDAHIAPWLFMLCIVKASTRNAASRDQHYAWYNLTTCEGASSLSQMVMSRAPGRKFDSDHDTGSNPAILYVWLATIIRPSGSGQSALHRTQSTRYLTVDI